VDLALVALAGFAAAMVDGALGMGFGPTSSSILLGGGLSPAAVSTTVNVAKVATGLAAGVAHWRFRNVDRRLVLQLALPGCLGATVGVTVLARVDGDRSGGAAPGDAAARAVPPFDERGITAAAATGGVTNGLVGAWGPVVTPFLLHRGLPPRFAIGSVNTAEVVVAAVSAGSLFAALGGDGVALGTVGAMLAGGVVAAPLAAAAVRRLPARLLGVAVGALLLTTNVRELARWAQLGPARWPAYAAVAAAVGLAALRPRLARRRLVPSA
jgi:hypothetical protein